MLPSVEGLWGKILLANPQNDGDCLFDTVSMLLNEYGKKENGQDRARISAWQLRQCCSVAWGKPQYAGLLRAVASCEGLGAGAYQKFIAQDMWGGKT